jgi:hypothetical protein
MVSLLATRSVQVKQAQRTKCELKTDKLGMISGQIEDDKRTNQGLKSDKLRIPILIVIELLYNCLYSCYIVVIKRACARLGNSLRSFGLFQECVE